MTLLPDLMRRAPKIFYALAFIVASVSFGLTYWEVLLQNNAYSAEIDQFNRLAVFKGLYQALLEAIYIIASGALIHVAIYIWDKMPEKTETAE